MSDQRQSTPVNVTPADVAWERIFATSMRELRERQNMSQATLAENLYTLYAIKLDASAIARIEKNAHGSDGARVIRLGEAMAIANILQSSLEEMLRPTAVNSLSAMYRKVKEMVDKARIDCDAIEMRLVAAHAHLDTAMARLTEIRSQLIAQHIETTNATPEAAWIVDDDGTVRAGS